MSEGPGGSEEETVDATEGIERDGELGVVRETVLRAYPDAVPELVTGGSVAELLASVEPARAAYARIAAAVAEATAGARPPEVAAVPPTVPAGAAGAAVDPGTLPAHELIKRGVRGRRNRG